MSLISLYQYILATIFSEWITDEDLCLLDNAVCCHGLRNHFLNAMQKCIFNTVVEKSYRDEKYEWMCLRGIGLKRIRFRDGGMHKNLLKLAARTIRVHLEASASFYVAALSPLALFVESLKLTGTTSDDIVEKVLQASGSGITELDLSDCKGLSNDFFPLIPIYCPALKQFSAPLRSKGCVLLDRCEIQQFSGNLLRVVNDVETLSYFHCELQSTDTNDDATTLILSGKCYRLIGLRATQKLNEEEMSFLLPLLPTVQTLYAIHSPRLLTATNCKWSNLTSLTVEVYSSKCLSSLIRSSPMLRRIELQGVERVSLETIEAICNHCPLLEVLWSKLSASEGVVMKLLDKCTKLNDVTIYQSFTNNILLLVAKDMDSVTLSGCGNNNDCIKRPSIHGLSYSSRGWLSHEVLLRMFSQNRNLQSLFLDVASGCTAYTIESLVNQCPLLTSLRILHCQELQSGCLSYLAKCKHLTSLTLRNMRKVTNTMIFELLKDKPHFLKLALPHCGGITGGILRMIARKCPLIRHVDISYCEECKNSDVIELLNGCYMLYHLDLNNCKDVTSEILSSVQSSRMRYLNMLGCNIFKETVIKFVASASFRPYCKLFY